MKRKNFKVSVGICISLLFFLNLNASLPLHRKSPTKNSPTFFHNKVTSSLSGTKSMLFEQMGNPSGENGILSDEFFIEPINSCQAVDDFIIPEGEDWFIETIYIRGILLGTLPLDLVNLFIYHDAGGMPGPEVFNHIGLPIIPSLTGNLEINIPGAPVFPHGKYWLSVQAMMPPEPAAEWYWAKEDSPTISDELHWRNPMGGLGGPPFWMPGSVIWAGSGSEDWNLSFSITGTIIPLIFPPVITDFYPPDCFPGENVTIYGFDFGYFSPDSYIEIEGMIYQDNILSWGNDIIIFEVPAVPGGDSINVKVISGPLVSNEIKLGWNFPELAYFMEPSGTDIIYWDTLHISVNPETYADDIDSARFFYKLKNASTWNYLATDTCGENQYIGTYHPLGEGDGWAYNWDVSSFQEDSIEIRTEMFDRFGFVLTGTKTLLIDKSPPIPFILDSSKLIGNKAIENDSVVFYYEIADPKVNNGILFNQAFQDHGEREVEKVCQWDQHITNSQGDSLKDDICAPTAGASCLKWLANKYHPGSELAGMDIGQVIRDLTTAAGTKNGEGTTSEGIRNGMNTEYKRQTGQSLETEVYPNNNAGSNKKKLADNMLDKFKNDWDVMLEIRQKDSTGKTVGHWVTMSSYHTICNFYYNPETNKYVTDYGMMVDFMDPGTGETTWGLLTNDDPPQFVSYNIDDDNHTGKSWIGKVVTAKPTSSKKDIPPLNYMASIPISDTGTYRFAIASNDLEDGITMLKLFTQSAAGDTLGSTYFSAYVGAYRPYAFFSSEQQFGIAPLTVEFENFSTPKDSIIYYKWDFGDGDTSNVENPIHTYTSNGIYDVSLIVSDGITYDTIINTNYVHVGTVLDLKVFLEGPFNGSEMNISLNPQLPLDQPYFESPWFYTGTEQVDSIPNDSIVDWILVELRETQYLADSAIGTTLIARKAGFLKSNGEVVDIDGRSYLHFDLSIADNLFAVIWHRNHLGIMSANPILVSNGIYTYDFTNSASQIYGGMSGSKELIPGVWGMVAGDGNSDGQINNNDKNDVWLSQNGNTGYLNADMNIDADVNSNDIDNYWIPNSGNGSQIPGEIPQGGYKSMIPE